MVKAAFILAKEKEAMQPVFGIPAVQRLVFLMDRLGIETVQVLTVDESMASVLSDLLPQRTIHIFDGREALPEILGNLHFAERDCVLVVKAHHVIDQKSLTEFTRTVEGGTEGPGDPIKGGDRDIVYALESDGAARLDAVYAVSPNSLGEVVQAIWLHTDSDTSILESAEVVTTSSGLPCMVKSDKNSTEAAEKRLSQSLAAATAHRDGFMARHFDRHLSHLISRRLARTIVTPNGVTLVNVAIGLAAAFLLSLGGYSFQICGTLLFLLCVVLDGVDGEIARLKFQETVFGHYLDIITDNIVHCAIFIGLAFGLYHQSGNTFYLYLLLVLLGGFVCCATAVYHVSRGKATRPTSAAVHKLTGLLANRDFAYLLVVLAVLGRLSWFLIGAAAGSYIFAAVVLALDLRERRSSHAP